MNSGQFRRTRLAAAVAGAVLTMAAGQALGSAFALQEQSGSGLGNAFAGGAASAEDASTIYFNPAGMSRLPLQVVVAGSLVCPSSKFSDSGSAPAALQPLGGSGGDAGSCAAIPAMYLSVPINAQWAFGIGVNVPFGLKTEYDSNWIGRFQGVESKLETINVNPALSWKPSDMLSFGAGFSYQHIKATLTNQVNYAGAIAQAAQQAAAAGQIPVAFVAPVVAAYAGSEAGANIQGNDNGYGWNIGMMFEPDKQTRFGLAYRSSIKYTINGSANFSTPPVPTLPSNLVPVATVLSTAINNGPLVNTNVTLALRVPSTTNASFFRQIDNRWDVMGDVQYTDWHSVQQLQIVRSNGTALQTVPENFRSTWRVAGGANYHYNDQWMFRGGLAFDQSPVNNTDRTVRLPDEDRTWFSVGAQYRMSPQWTFDFGYTFIYVQNPSISQNQGSTNSFGLVSGTYHSNVNIAALQVTYNFK
ncbi:MAG: outer membrane protein transport protein [Betaproteobacteria bacterium]